MGEEKWIDTDKHIRDKIENRKKSSKLSSRKDKESPSNIQAFRRRSSPQEKRKKIDHISYLTSQRRISSYSEPSQADLKKKLVQIANVTSQRREGLRKDRLQFLRTELYSSTNISQKSSSSSKVSERNAHEKGKQQKREEKTTQFSEDKNFHLVHGWIEPTKSVSSNRNKVNNFVAPKIKVCQTSDNGIFSFWSVIPPVA